MLEAKIQKEIVKYLELQGYLVIRMNAGKGRHNIRLAPPGTPDLLCIMDKGKSLWIEVKQPDKHPTEIQQEMHHRLTVAGHEVIVAHSLNEVIKGMQAGELTHTPGDRLF